MERVIAMRELSGGRWFGAALAALAVALVASTAAAQSLEEVIAKTIKAQGGKDALLNLKSLTRKGEVDVDGSFGQMKGTVEESIVPWKKAFRALDLEVFAQKDGFNGKVAWRDGMMGVQELEGDEAGQIKQSIDLNPFMKLADRGYKAEKLEDEKVDEVDYYVIQLTPAKGPAVKVFVDKESDQIRRTSLKANNPQFGEVEITVETSDYQEFGPVKLPTKQKIVLGDIFQIMTSYTETKVDGEIDEAIFEMPEVAAAEPAKDDAKKDDATKDDAKKDDAK
jgi:hypothetical protein